MVSITRSVKRKARKLEEGDKKETVIIASTKIKRARTVQTIQDKDLSVKVDSLPPPKSKKTNFMSNIEPKSNKSSNSAIIKPMTKTLPHSVDPQTGKRYWLIKSEPLSRIEGKDQEVAYPLSNLLTNSFTTWDGVRNHEAKNHMLNMSLGDYCLFYHSNCPHPGIVGIVEVCKEAHPDHSQWELGNKYVDPKSSHDSPRWWCVDVKFNRRLKSKLTLDILRADPELAEMALVKRGRLSVTPVRTEEFLRVLQMEKESALKDDLDCEIPRDLIDIVS